MNQPVPPDPNLETSNTRRIVVLTGLSGAGKTNALRAFEDAGYFCVDNLPPAMIPAVVEAAGSDDEGARGVVVVTDIRGRRYFGDHPEDSIGEVGDGGGRQVVFMEADDPTLIRRYKESRRPHPTARNGDVLAAIHDERRYFANLREKADLVVDTSNLSAAEVRVRFKQLAETLSERLTVSLLSFGFKHGAPLDVDMLLDVRFLPNPHYDPELRPLTGHDAPVREAVLGHGDTREFLDRLQEMLAFLIPRYAAEGKSYFTLGVGCTGGKHRSVAIVEELSRRLTPLDGDLGVDFHVRHRDVENGGYTP